MYKPYELSIRPSRILCSA